MQIALVAYDALPEPAQRELVLLLREHPRFDEDFRPREPAELSSDAERARWIFAHAATWPDLARAVPELAHGSWHYVNLPVWLRRGELSSCAQARRALLAAPPAESVLRALPAELARLRDASAPRAERALALSWVLHLVGDAHQPLHTTALFSEARYPDGDRGGNDINVAGAASLHALWDGLLGGDAGFAAADAEARALRDDRELSRLAARGARDLDVLDWAERGCNLARTFVYTPAVLRAVAKPAPARAEGKPEVVLGEAYRAAAIRVARQRARIAGARLATLLAQSVSTATAARE